MKKFLLFFFLLLLSQRSFTQNNPVTATDSLKGQTSKERACFDVYFYDLSVRVAIQQKYISGFSKIYFSIKETTSTIQLDLHSQLTIHSIKNEQAQQVNFTRKANAVFVTFDAPIEKGMSTYLTIEYEGTPKVAQDPPWDGGFVWTTDSLGNPWVGVACEGIGASSWWPCKDFSSDEPDSIRMQFEVPEKLFCASNGNLESITKTERQTAIYQWAVHYPINLYNVTVNIGDYVQFSDPYVSADGSRFSLDFYVLSYNLEKAKKHFKQVKTILTGYEKLFGPYPFHDDGYALIETPYWGMEHQSGISYGNRYVNNMMGKLDYIIVHETGHEWWGNAVSTADHGELWIHETFTTYGESLLLEYLYGKEAALNHLLTQKKTIKNKEPILGPLGVNYHYWEDSDMYYKGAWVLHTLRNSVDNDSLWFALFPAIQKNFAFRQIHSEELIAFISTFLKKDCKAFFNYYLTETTMPVLEYSVQRVKKKTIIRYRWAIAPPDFGLSIPIRTDLNKKQVIAPSERFQTFTLPSSANLEKLFDENVFYVVFKQIKGKIGENKK